MNITTAEIDDSKQKFSINVKFGEKSLFKLLKCQSTLDIKVCFSKFITEVEDIYKLPVFEKIPFNSKKIMDYIIEFLCEAFSLGKEITFFEVLHEGSSSLNKIYIKTGNGTEDFIRGHIWSHRLVNQMRKGQEGFGPEKNYKPISVEEFELLRRKILKIIEENKLTKEEIFLMTGSRSQAMYKLTSNYSGKKTGFINSQKFYDQLKDSLKMFAF